ncbi:hypothetical protein [Spirillospora sp. NPDC029432]|uniref:hypothetical protein n=1 Tax=Spirillospora sp. NPDC029432 TaxID=3154599 RepID=UPI003453C60A
MGRSRLAENVCGEQVRVALMEARPAGLTIPQLTAATGLTPYQVRKGLLFIREVGAMAHLTPLTWSRASGYAFADDPAVWLAYTMAVLRAELTRVNRLITATIAPCAQSYPHDEDIAIVMGQINGVQATLRALTRAR